MNEIYDWQPFSEKCMKKQLKEFKEMQEIIRLQQKEEKRSAKKVHRKLNFKDRMIAHKKAEKE